MAVTAKLYGNFLVQALNEEHDWAADDIKVMLTTSTYTPDQDAHDYKDDITNEVVGTGYVAGGVSLTGATMTYTGATNKIKLDADDASWASSTITARTAVVYNNTGGGADASRGLVCYQQESGDVTSTAGTFTVQWHADGIVEITVS